MMCKWIKYLFVGVVLLSNCQAPSTPRYPQQDEIVSIAYLKSLYRNYPLKLNINLGIEGVLKSEDSQGNFFNTFVIEDNSGGIDIKIDMKDYFAFYPSGYKYAIRCNGLAISSYGGTLQLGYLSPMSDGMIVPIPADKITSHIYPTSNKEYETIPQMIEIDKLSHRFISCWVGLSPVQFIDEELDLAWTDHGYDTDRHLINLNGDTLIVRTSQHAQYAQHILPRGSGHVAGILGYFNQKYQLRPTTLYYVLLDKPRFNPTDVTCSLAEVPPTACLSTPVCEIHLPTI